MAEVFVTFNDRIAAPDGTFFLARACGRPMADGRWEGWIEFESLDGAEVLRSGRETTQPNRTDTAYWATGLTPVYLEGALERALHPLRVRTPRAPVAPAFDGPRPADEEIPPPVDSVINPFSVYRNGEAVLRRQLGALASWHLVNVIRDYELSERPVADLERATPDELIELIVTAVREHASAHAD
jgi:hypothetical protein